MMASAQRGRGSVTTEKRTRQQGQCPQVRPGEGRPMVYHSSGHAHKTHHSARASNHPRISG